MSGDRHGAPELCSPGDRLNLELRVPLEVTDADGVTVTHEIVIRLAAGTLFGVGVPLASG